MNYKSIKLIMNKIRATNFLSLMALVFLVGGIAIPARAQANDAQIQAEVQKSLSNKKFSDVQVAVHNGIVQLTGTVDLYSAKEDADHKAHHVKKVAAVANDIEVKSGTLTDEQMQAKLAEKVAYDRVGYGTTPFNAITVSVQNGVVTLGGHAYGPTDADSALSLVANFQGVRDVINDIVVDPLSPMDDQTRMAVYRAVYGFPSLNRYAADPVKPIRITVVNGHVTLVGVVDSQSDKDVAGLRANGVPNVFSVENDLQVAGKKPEK